MSKNVYSNECKRILNYLFKYSVGYFSIFAGDIIASRENWDILVN